MLNMTPIQEAVTGREQLGDITKPEQALAQFYKALNSRDLAVLEENWDSSAEAAMDNPLGGDLRVDFRPVHALGQSPFGKQGNRHG